MPQAKPMKRVKRANPAPLTIELNDYLVDILKSSIWADIDAMSYRNYRKCDFQELQGEMERTLALVKIVSAFESDR